MHLPRLASFALIGAALLLSACSSSGHSSRPSSSSTTTSTGLPTTSGGSTSTASTPTTTTSPVTTPTGPRFVSLSGPPQPVHCYAPTSVEVRWETRGAGSVTLRINGGAVFATYPGGVQSQLLPLACDGNPQNYTFTARATDGRTATKTLTLTERRTQ